MIISLPFQNFVDPSTSLGQAYYSLHPPPHQALCPAPWAAPLRALCCAFGLQFIQWIIHKERPEGVRVRPAHRCHRPLRASPVTAATSRSRCPGPLFAWTRGQLHVDMFCHGGVIYKVPGGLGGWQGGSARGLGVVEFKPCPCPCPPPRWPWRRPLAWDGQHLGLPAAGWLRGNRNDGNEGGLPLLTRAFVSTASGSLPASVGIITIVEHQEGGRRAVLVLGECPGSVPVTLIWRVDLLFYEMSCGSRTLQATLRQKLGVSCVTWQVSCPILFCPSVDLLVLTSHRSLWFLYSVRI